MKPKTSFQRLTTRANSWFNWLYYWQFFMGCAPLVLIVSLPALMNYTNVQEQEVQVIDFESRQSGESGELRLIHTNSGVFVNSDTVFWFKFNSSDVQTTLIQAKQSGKKVRIKTAGSRIPLLSQYPNILEIH